MSREEAIGFLKAIREMGGVTADYRKALDIAIKALEDQRFREGSNE